MTSSSDIYVLTPSPAISGQPNRDQPESLVTGSARIATERKRRWRIVVAAVVAGGFVSLLAIFGGPMLADSATTFGHLDWPWLILALLAEASSMAAFARMQRRLLAAGGTPLHLGSVMAVTYAGNAISVSLPLGGSQLSTGFSFRQFSRHGIDPAVAGWALAVSGIISSSAFAAVLAGGAIISGSPTAAFVGLGGAFISLVPALCVVGALRYPKIRHGLNRIFARLLTIPRALIRRPGPGTENAAEQFLDRLSTLHLPRREYVTVFGLAIWNWIADCACLAFAIRATGPHIPWRGLLLAYGAGMVAGSIGLTPGGLGIIEAALCAALVTAGVTGHHALPAVLIYRLISFWLVMAAGWVLVVVVTRNTTQAGKAATAPPQGPPASLAETRLRAGEADPRLRRPAVRRR